MFSNYTKRKGQKSIWSLPNVFHDRVLNSNTNIRRGFYPFALTFAVRMIIVCGDSMYAAEINIKVIPVNFCRNIEHFITQIRIKYSIPQINFEMNCYFMSFVLFCELISVANITLNI